MSTSRTSRRGRALVITSTFLVVITFALASSVAASLLGLVTAGAGVAVAIRERRIEPQTPQPSTTYRGITILCPWDQPFDQDAE
jgi:hypothetical protein